MIKHIWTVLCQKSIIDNETNNFSLLDILEQINIIANKLPPTKENDQVIFPFNFEAVSLWVKTGEKTSVKGQARVRIVTPDGQIGDGPTFSIDLSNKTRFRSRVRFGGLPIKGSGQYKVLVQLKKEDATKWEDVASVPLQVVLEIKKNSKLN